MRRVRGARIVLAMRWAYLSQLVLVLAVVTAAGFASAGGFSPDQRCCFSTETRPYEPHPFPARGLHDELKPAGRTTRGVHLTSHWLERVGAKETAELMKSAHLNAVVVDAKDEWGQVLWRSEVPLSKRVQRFKIRDPATVFATFRDAGIYVIARIVCFKDSKLPLVRPDLSIRSGEGRRLFSSGAGWLDQYSDEVQDYLISLAVELEKLGVDEIQFDYVRFPKGKSAQYGHWLHRDERNRAEVIADFLQKADRALSIPISVDIFGLTTLVDGDPRRLGQTIERLAPFVEVISPMMYANGMTSYFPKRVVNDSVYSVIQCGLWRARLKAPDAVLRPYLQAFPNNVPFFGPEFIAQQVVATERAGGDGFLFWNPTMKNSEVFAAMRKMGEPRLVHYGMRDGKRVQPRRPGEWCVRSGSVGNTIWAEHP